MRCFQEKENCSSQINYVFTASDKAGTERVRHPLSNITTEIVSKSISQQKPFAKKGHNSLFAIYSKKIGTDRESLTVKKYRKFATESKNLNQFVESKCSKSVSKNLFPSTDPYSIS